MNINTDIEKLPVKWLNFYTIYLIPIRILLALIITFKVFLLNHNFHITPMLLVVLSLSVFIGLRGRKLWGWWLNWLYLIGDLMSIPLRYLFSSENPIREFEPNVIGFVLIGLCWFLPNYIYFKKRRGLFA
jgi:hypothetical protein